MQEGVTASYGFIGLGLIGGSIARAIRAADADARIIAYDPDPTAPGQAKEDAVVTTIASEIGEAFTGCDIVFLCAPVAINNENLKRLKPYLSPETTVTDIGSVKGPIHELVRSLSLERQFVGSHPMTGSERAGYQNSKAVLLENAYYILTHTEGVELDRIAQMQSFAELIGAIPLTLTAEEHYYVTGAVSHLPHVISATLVNLIHDADDGMETMKQIAAGGFKDITRISSSSPELWQQICLTNRDHIVPLLDRYIEALREARNTIANRSEDALKDFFARARDYRESFLHAVDGPIARAFVLYVEIADMAGAIAEALTLLSNGGISVKNIGITHNREAAYGAMMLEFYDETALRQAHALLNARGYAVSRR